LEDHYKPQGPTDRVPTDPVAIAVALADKLDTLVGFWAINEKPTGSKDPYALRRAALGVVRILVENGVSLRLSDAFLAASSAIALRSRDAADTSPRSSVKAVNAAFVDPDLLAFFHDRLKVYLRDQGARHDLIDAVLSASPVSPREGEMSSQPTEGGKAANDDLLDIVRRVEALGAFLSTEDGKNLLAGTRRAANILAAEEKKGTSIATAVDPSLFEVEAETNLFNAVITSLTEAAQAIETARYGEAMAALAMVREPVDSFFEAVMVNAEDAAVRSNRLALLAMIRQATGQIADFGRIAG